MQSEAERCAQAAGFMRLHTAVLSGDLEALRAGVDHPALFPNGPMALAILLSAGADSALRTRIDDCETPGDMARAASLEALAAVLS